MEAIVLEMIISKVIISKRIIWKVITMIVNGYAYPFIDDEVAEYIITNRKKGIGLDNISLDPVGSLNYHKKVFKEIKD